jgi:hypothetical protein
MTRRISRAALAVAASLLALIATYNAPEARAATVNQTLGCNNSGCYGSNMCEYSYGMVCSMAGPNQCSNHRCYGKPGTDEM